MDWLDLFLKTTNDCDAEDARDHQRGLLAYIKGWSKSVHLTNERGIAAEFEIAVKSYMRIFLSEVHDAHDAEHPERVAHISSADNPHQRRDLSLTLVESFLPSNYSVHEVVTVDGAEILTIRGRDSAGWTMDGYVIPRLASGNIFAKEVQA